MVDTSHLNNRQASLGSGPPPLEQASPQNAIERITIPESELGSIVHQNADCRPRGLRGLAIKHFVVSFFKKIAVVASHAQALHHKGEKDAVNALSVLTSGRFRSQTLLKSLARAPGHPQSLRPQGRPSLKHDGSRTGIERMENTAPTHDRETYNAFFKKETKKSLEGLSDIQLYRVYKRLNSPAVVDLGAGLRSQAENTPANAQKDELLSIDSRLGIMKTLVTKELSLRSYDAPQSTEVGRPERARDVIATLTPRATQGSEKFPLAIKESIGAFIAERDTFSGPDSTANLVKNWGGERILFDAENSERACDALKPKVSLSFNREPPNIFGDGDISKKLSIYEGDGGKIDALAKFAGAYCDGNNQQAMRVLSLITPDVMSTAEDHYRTVVMANPDAQTPGIVLPASMRREGNDTTAQLSTWRGRPEFSISKRGNDVVIQVIDERQIYGVFHDDNQESFFDTASASTKFKIDIVVPPTGPVYTERGNFSYDVFY